MKSNTEEYKNLDGILITTAYKDVAYIVHRKAREIFGNNISDVIKGKEDIYSIFISSNESISMIEELDKRVNFANWLKHKKCEYLSEKYNKDVFLMDYIEYVEVIEDAIDEISII